MFSCGPEARSSYYLPVFMDFQARHVTSEWRTRVRSASVKRNHPSNYSKGIKWERFAAAGQRNVCALSLFVFNSSVPNRFFFFFTSFCWWCQHKNANSRRVNSTQRGRIKKKVFSRSALSTVGEEFELWLWLFSPLLFNSAVRFFFVSFSPYPTCEWVNRRET